MYARVGDAWMRRLVKEKGGSQVHVEENSLIQDLDAQKMGGLQLRVARIL